MICGNSGGVIVATSTDTVDTSAETTAAFTDAVDTSAEITTNTTETTAIPTKTTNIMPPPRTKILTVFGTRPEVIKMAPVIRELRKWRKTFETHAVFMGQHRELSEPLIRLFELAPETELNLMTHQQRLGEITARLMEKMDALVAATKPDWILAQGDTVTVLAAAIIAHFNRCKFGHVEAGLRSRDFQHPFPEEFNRRVANVHCDAYFAPTSSACENLRNEGVPENRIFHCGNTVVDALTWARGMPFELAKSPLAQFADLDKVVLVTAHRRENFMQSHHDIFTALLAVSKKYPDWRFIYPVHLNPDVRRAAREYFQDAPGIHLIAPLDYLSFINLMKAARFIISDSGGVQEEAPSFGVPVLIIRNVTERPEAVDTGHNRIIGTDRDKIRHEITRQIESPPPLPATAGNPYGDGQAALRIVNFLHEHKSS